MRARGLRTALKAAWDSDRLSPESVLRRPRGLSCSGGHCDCDSTLRLNARTRRTEPNGRSIGLDAPSLGLHLRSRSDPLLGLNAQTVVSQRLDATLARDPHTRRSHATLAKCAARAKCATRTGCARRPRGPSAPGAPGASDAPRDPHAPSEPHAPPAPGELRARPAQSVPGAEVHGTAHIGAHADSQTSFSKANATWRRGGQHGAWCAHQEQFCIGL